MTRARLLAVILALGLAPVLPSPGTLAADRAGLMEQMRFGDVRPVADRPEGIAIPVAGPTATDWLAAGHAARLRNDLAGAIDLYKRAGESSEALFWLATVQRWVGDLDASAATFERLLARDPGHADGLLGDAQVALRTGHPERAEKELRHLLALVPDHPEAPALLLRAYLQEGKRREAYDFVERTFTGEERLRHQAEIAFDLAWYGRAARAYEALHAAHPDDPALAVALGRTYERMGYLDRAANLYADALRAHPDDPALRLRAAAVNRWLGEYGIARRNGEEVLAADPERPEALLERAYQELSRDHLFGVGVSEVLPGPVPEPDVVPEIVPERVPEVAPEPEAKAAPAPQPAPAPEAPVAAVPVAAPEAPAEVSAPAAPAPPMVVVHQVKPGESLSRLAGTYLGDIHRWPEIADANPSITDPNRVVPGQKVVILVPAPGVRLAPHRVRPGDSLSRIARAYLGDAGLWPAVWRANPAITDPNRIEPGQLVRVPIPGGELPAGLGLARHTVKRGETLGRIARDYLGDATRWNLVWRVNPSLKDPNRIYVGQVLNVPRGTPTPAPVVAAPAPPPAPPAPAAPPAPVIAQIPAPPAQPAAPAPESPRLRVHREGWGAAQWAARFVADHPESREGRHLLGRIDLRRMRFAAAYDRLNALYLEDPSACDVCADLAAAREARLPVVDAFFRFDTARDQDGRADPTVAVPTPVRYRTLAWGLGARDRVLPRLTLGVRYDSADTSLKNLVTDATIYDFTARTAWLEATGHIADAHTVSAGVGTTDYSPNNGSSIADRTFTRLRLAWDLERWNGQAHLAAEQAPYLGRSIPPQQAYSLFRERRLSAAAERRLTPRSTVFGRYSRSGFDDGTTLYDGALGARFRLGTHRIEAEYAIDHQAGRFLDEAGGGLDLVFVRTHEARLSDRWAWPFPFRFSAEGRFRSFADNTTVVSATPQVSPSNSEVAASAEAAYAHPALAPLSFGAGYDYVKFDKDAFAYDTVDARGPRLFAELAGADGDCWSYRLRYTWALWWDEDPANSHFQSHTLEGSARMNAGRHLSAGIGGRYGRTATFGEEAIRLTADLTWRF